MTLRANQLRALTLMEQRLHAGEPKLAAMFSIFTRLAHDEPLPNTETISRRLWPSSAWRRGRRSHRAGAIAMPLLLAGLVFAVVLSAALGPSVGRCAPSGTHYLTFKTGLRSGGCAERLPLRSWRSPGLYGK